MSSQPPQPPRPASACSNRAICRDLRPAERARSCKCAWPDPLTPWLLSKGDERFLRSLRISTDPAPEGEQ